MNVPHETNDIVHCDWPDCRAPLAESDIHREGHRAYCRYCTGIQGMPKQEMADQISDEEAQRKRNPKAEPMTNDALRKASDHWFGYGEKEEA